MTTTLQISTYGPAETPRIMLGVTSSGGNSPFYNTQLVFSRDDFKNLLVLLHSAEKALETYNGEPQHVIKSL